MGYVGRKGLAQFSLIGGTQLGQCPGLNGDSALVTMWERQAVKGTFHGVSSWHSALLDADKSGVCVFAGPFGVDSA